MSELRTILTSTIVSITICLIAAGLFYNAFYSHTPLGVCEKYGWMLEGTGPYQHKHCYDPKTRQMYLPREIDP